MKTRISSKGQLVLPAELRRRDRIEPGEEFEIEAVGRGEYRLRRVRRRNRGLVEHLLACPVKGWFRPLDRTETTDTIRPPTFE
jgi:AbrB family looped-hinge helix DNA binding protein